MAPEAGEHRVVAQADSQRRRGEERFCPNWQRWMHHYWQQAFDNGSKAMRSRIRLSGAMNDENCSTMEKDAPRPEMNERLEIES